MKKFYVVCQMTNKNIVNFIHCTRGEFPDIKDIKIHIYKLEELDCVILNCFEIDITQKFPTSLELLGEIV